MEENKENIESVVEKNADLTSEMTNIDDIQKSQQSDTSLTTLSTMPSKALNLRKQTPKLTLRNQSFLNHLIAGKTTLEAYRLAGYKGNVHAAYQLRSQLKEQLKVALEAEGLDRNGLKIRIKQMLEMGLDPEVKTLSPKMYLETLRFADKLMEHEHESDIKISPFLINTSAVTINESK